MSNKKYSVDLEQLDFELPQPDTRVIIDREKKVAHIYYKNNIMATLSFAAVARLDGICCPTRVYDACSITPIVVSVDQTRKQMIAAVSAGYKESNV